MARQRFPKDLRESFIEETLCTPNRFLVLRFLMVGGAAVEPKSRAGLAGGVEASQPERLIHLGASIPRDLGDARNYQVKCKPSC